MQLVFLVEHEESVFEMDNLSNFRGSEYKGDFEEVNLFGSGAADMPKNAAWKYREGEYRVKTYKILDKLEVFFRRLKYELMQCNSILQYPSELIMTGTMTPLASARIIEETPSTEPMRPQS